MKVINLLNKIANGEINENIKIEYQNGLNCEYCTIREFFDRYIIDKENLNLEITLEDTSKEDKKIEQLKYMGEIVKETYSKLIRDEYNRLVLAVDYDKMQKIIDNLQQRIDKAINYITHEWFKREQIGVSHLSFSYDELQHILDILRGKDNENN